MTASQNSSSQGSKKNGSTSTIKPAHRLLMSITIISFVLLVILMIFSGNQSALALNEDKLLVMQQAKVEVASVDIESAYDKPRIVFGQIEPLQQSDIGFELSGTLTELLVMEGDYVKQGQVLAVLNKARLNARQNELESALQSALANATLAEVSAQRVAQLVVNKLEPKQRLDEVEAQLDAATASVNEARARLKSIDVELNKSSLFAPFDGQIVRQYADKGTVLAPGSPIFSILANDTLEVRFGLPEQTAFGLVPEQTHILDIRGTTFNAKVKSIASQRNSVTRTIEAVFSVDLSQFTALQKSMVVSGDLVSMTVNIPMQKRGAWVPTASLASGVRGLWSLYVVDNNDIIQTRLVSIDYADESKAFVTGALNQGDRVVISGIHRLAPKQKIVNVVGIDIDTALSRSVVMP